MTKATDIVERMLNRATVKGELRLLSLFIDEPADLEWAWPCFLVWTETAAVQCRAFWTDLDLLRVVLGPPNHAVHVTDFLDEPKYNTCSALALVQAHRRRSVDQALNLVEAIQRDFHETAMGKGVRSALELIREYLLERNFPRLGYLPYARNNASLNVKLCELRQLLATGPTDSAGVVRDLMFLYPNDLDIKVLPQASSDGIYHDYAIAAVRRRYAEELEALDYLGKFPTTDTVLPAPDAWPALKPTTVMDLWPQHRDRVLAVAPLHMIIEDLVKDRSKFDPEFLANLRRLLSVGQGDAWHVALAAVLRHSDDENQFINGLRARFGRGCLVTDDDGVHYPVETSTSAIRGVVLTRQSHYVLPPGHHKITSIKTECYDFDVLVFNDSVDVKGRWFHVVGQSDIIQLRPSTSDVHLYVIEKVNA